MDLNYLFHRQQVERSRAKAAASAAARKVHEALAREYEKQIERWSNGRLRFFGGRKGSKLDGRG